MILKLKPGRARAEPRASGDCSDQRGPGLNSELPPPEFDPESPQSPKRSADQSTSSGEPEPFRKMLIRPYVLILFKKNERVLVVIKLLGCVRLNLYAIPLHTGACAPQLNEQIGPQTDPS